MAKTVTRRNLISSFMKGLIDVNPILYQNEKRNKVNVKLRNQGSQEMEGHLNKTPPTGFTTRQMIKQLVQN